MTIDTIGAARRIHDRPRIAASRVECSCRSFGFGRVLTPVLRSERSESQAAAAQRNGTPDVPAVIGSISA
jgi:hypothetical protein